MRVLMVALALFLVVGCAAEDEASVDDAVGTEEAEEEDPAPTADPKADYESNCDMLLGDYTSSGFNAHVIADARIQNTGNVGVVIDVRASWDQAGEGPLKEAKTVKVPAGGRKAVHFKKAISSDQIDKVQSADYRCKVKAKIVDTFGAVEE